MRKTTQIVPDTSRTDRLVQNALKAEGTDPKAANIYDVISVTRLPENEVRESLKRLCAKAQEG